MRKLFPILLAILLTGCATTKGNVALVVSPTKPQEQKTPSIQSIIQEQGEAVVLIVTYDNSGNVLKLGSGFFVRADGVLITNYHVIEDAYSAVIKLTDGKVFDDVSIIDFNAEWDIAVLKVKGSGFSTVKLGNSDNVQTGQKIVVIGNPEGLQNTVSDGLISSIRKIEPQDNDYVFQISAPISMGSSGGPVYNMNGEVIGISALILETGQNLNFAIPIKFALPLIEKTSRKDLAVLTKELTEKAIGEYIRNQQTSTEFKPEETIFEEALQYYQQANEKSGNYMGVFGTANQEAIEFLKKAVNVDPNYHAAHYVLCLSYKLVNQLDLAEKELLIANSLKPLFAYGHVELGEVYYKLGNLAKAKSELEIGIKLKPDYPYAFFLLGKAYRDNKEYKNAIEYFNRANELIESGYSKALFEMAMIYSEMREFGNALDTLRRIEYFYSDDEGLNKGLELYGTFYESNKKNPVFLQNYAYIYFLKDDYENAIKYFTKSLEIYKSNFKCNYELGISYKNLPIDFNLDEDSYNRIYVQNMKKAGEYLSKAIQETPLKYNVLISLAELYETYSYPEKNDEKAISLYKMAIELKPLNTELYLNVSNLYKNIKKYSEAKQFAYKAISLNDKIPSAYVTLGDIYKEEKDFNKAIENYNKSLELDKSSAYILYKIGRIYEEQEQFSDALTKYQEAYEKSKSNKFLRSLYLKDIATIYIKQEKYLDAIDTYKKILNDDPNDSDALFYLAFTYSQNNQLEKAIETYNKVIEITPNESSAHYNLGLAYLRLGKEEDNEKILNHFKKYLELTKDIKGKEENRKFAMSQIAKIEFPLKLSKLKRQGGDIGVIASLLLIVEEYNTGNNKLINGIKETKYEDYQNIVSPDVYVAENLFESLKIDISKIKTNDQEIQSVIDGYEKAISLRIEGIKLISQAYYTKKIDYKGEYEKGRAKIQIADNNFLEALKDLQQLVKKYKEHFSEYDIEVLSDDINYYATKYKD